MTMEQLSTRFAGRFTRNDKRAVAAGDVLPVEERINIQLLLETVLGTRLSKEIEKVDGFPGLRKVKFYSLLREDEAIDMERLAQALRDIEYEVHVRLRVNRTDNYIRINMLFAFE